MEVGPDREAGRAKEVSYLRVGEPSHLRCPQRVSPDWFLCFCDLPPSISFCTSHYTDSLHTVLCGQRTLFMEMCAVPLGDL